MTASSPDRVVAAAAPSATAPAGKPLRILQIGTGFEKWGGTEMHLLSLARAQADAGHTVAVACPPGGWTDSRARALGLATLAATVRTRWDLAALSALRRAIVQFQPDALHVHSPRDLVVPPLAARLEGRIPVFYTRHLGRVIRSRLTRTLLTRGVYCTIGVSEFVRQRLLEAGLPPEKVRTISNSAWRPGWRATVPPEATRAGWGVPAGVPVVGMLTRMSSEKGVTDFVDALALPGAGAAFGVVVGDGPQRQELERRAAERGLSGRLRLAGHTDDPASALAAMDVFVLASTWEEPCATVLQEAMALGLPCIATATGGTPEIAGDAALLVPKEDPAALAAALASLLGDPARRAALGAAGRARVEAHYGLAAMAERVVALYREAPAPRAR